MFNLGLVGFDAKFSAIGLKKGMLIHKVGLNGYEPFDRLFIIPVAININGS